MFPEPEDFRPERFLETSDPRLKDFDLPFGFGRRSCPGIHLALNSLFINISRILWAFDIKPVLDENGKNVLPGMRHTSTQRLKKRLLIDSTLFLPADSNNYTLGFNSRPVSFDCQFIPRNGKVAACIESEWQAAQSRLSEWQ